MLALMHAASLMLLRQRETRVQKVANRKQSFSQKQKALIEKSLNMAMQQNGEAPGTVHLVDIDGILAAKHAPGRAKDVLLIPVPSEDPDDPLNWSVNRKRLSIASICL